MAGMETARISWRAARVRHVRPAAVRIALRIAMVLFLVPLAFEALPALTGQELSGPVASVASAMRFAYLGAAIAASCALVLARGTSRDGGVAVDKRSVYVGKPERLRRIPRWSVVSARAVRGARRSVEVELSAGDVLRIEPRAPADAAWLCEALREEARAPADKASRRAAANAD